MKEKPKSSTKKNLLAVASAVGLAFVADAICPRDPPPDITDKIKHEMGEKAADIMKGEEYAFSVPPAVKKVAQNVDSESQGDIPHPEQKPKRTLEEIDALLKKVESDFIDSDGEDPTVIYDKYGITADEFNIFLYAQNIRNQLKNLNGETRNIFNKAGREFSDDDESSFFVLLQGLAQTKDIGGVTTLEDPFDPRLLEGLGMTRIEIQDMVRMVNNYFMNSAAISSKLSTAEIDPYLEILRKRYEIK